MICDILHRIELGTFNASEGYMLCKQIQDVRKSRRIVKDELEMLKSLNNAATSVQSRIKNVRKNIDRIENNHKNRFYKPRVLKDIM